MIHQKVRSAARTVRCNVHRYDHLAPHAEHAGFVAYAAAEVTALHWAVLAISAYLLITGVWVMIAKLEA